jgi:hypothetical protein
VTAELVDGSECGCDRCRGWQPGNDAWLKHGGYSILGLSDRTTEIADAIRPTMPAYAAADEPVLLLLATTLAGPVLGNVSQVLARERTVAVEANPRAISQMPNVSSNNPPGIAPTSPAPATPNSSSRLPPAKHA